MLRLDRLPRRGRARRRRASPGSPTVPASLPSQWQGYQIETSVFRAIVLLVALVVARARSSGRSCATSGTAPRRSATVLAKRRQKLGIDALVERHDRARRRRQGGRHARRDPGAQVAAQRAADASSARAGRAAHRRPHDGAPHLRSDARLARHRAARPARPLPRGAARGRDGGRRGTSPSAPWRSTRSSPGRSMRCSICSAASRDWAGALETIAIARKNGHIERPQADRRRAVLLDRAGAGRRGSRSRARADPGARGARRSRPTSCRPPPSPGACSPRAGTRRAPPRSCSGRGAARRIPISRPPTPTPASATARATASTASAARRAQPQLDRGPDRGGRRRHRGAPVRRGARRARAAAARAHDAARRHAHGAHRRRAARRQGPRARVAGARRQRAARSGLDRRRLRRRPLDAGLAGDAARSTRSSGACRSRSVDKSEGDVLASKLEELVALGMPRSGPEPFEDHPLKTAAVAPGQQPTAADTVAAAAATSGIPTTRARTAPQSDVAERTATAPAKEAPGRAPPPQRGSVPDQPPAAGSVNEAANTTNSAPARRRRAAGEPRTKGEASDARIFVAPPAPDDPGPEPGEQEEAGLPLRPQRA